MAVKRHPNPNHIPKPTDILTIRMTRARRDELVLMIDDYLEGFRHIGPTGSASRKRAKHLEYVASVLTTET